MTDQYEGQDVELNEDENEVLEAHDPKNAEAQSVDSVDKAADAVKGKAPARKGDVIKSEPMPKTKSGMINAMYNKMSKMKKEDLSATFKSMMGEDFDAEDMAVLESSEYKEDLEALIKNDKTLSEDFKVKAATIFEAAVSSRVAEKEAELNEQVAQRIQELEEEYAKEMENGLSEAKEALVDKIDSYLNYVVESWMEENKLAIEQGLRTEIAENFMNNLKNLFVESYIEVPESKIDLVDDLVEQVKELEGKVDKMTEANMNLKENVVSLKKEKIINEAARDLAATQASKLHKLSENVDFVSESDFAEKVETIKESYFSQKTIETVESIVEETEGEAEDLKEATSDTMQRYLSALRQSK
jgi:cell division protein FtsB